MPGGWEGAGDKSRFPPDWPHRRNQRRALAQGRCEWIKANGARCNVDCWDDGECDHHEDRNDHRIESLRWLCKKHHGRKSSAQGNAARTPRPTRQRAPEPHPAATTTQATLAAALATAKTLGGDPPPRRPLHG